MKRGLVTLVCLLPLLAIPSVGVAQQAGQAKAPQYPKAVLSKTFEATLGDMIAESLANLVTATRSVTDPPTLVIYDRDAKKIGVIIYGSKTTLDGAKRAIDASRAQMHNSVAFIGAVYHASLDEADLAFYYYHDEVVLIGWEDGKYTVGGQ